MIISGLLNILYTALSILLAPINIPQLPDTATQIINDAFSYITAGAGILANYTDLAYLLVLFGLILVIDVAIKIYHFVMWVIRKIPMLGMS